MPMFTVTRRRRVDRETYLDEYLVGGLDQIDARMNAAMALTCDVDEMVGAVEFKGARFVRSELVRP